AIAAIRAVDSSHILFIEVPLSGEGAGLQLVSDPNVVYSYHEYSPFIVTHAGADWAGDTPVPDDYAYPGQVLVGMEEASRVYKGQPANWHFWTDSGVTGIWSNEAAHSGQFSLELIGDGEGYGNWTQANWIFTAPLFGVQPGDTFRVRGWILAPHNNGGIVHLGLDYLNGVHEYYDRERLRADMQPYIHWAASNNVPLFVGEFGRRSAAPGDSRYNLIADMISVMNEAGLHWTMWNYRDPSLLGFGLYFGNDLDERLAEILRRGLESKL
ncbi:MAG: cellulase family glycosylhydrolase, partial [Candidatus Bipolaricaulia bacterium]